MKLRKILLVSHRCRINFGEKDSSRGKKYKTKIVCTHTEGSHCLTVDQLTQKTKVQFYDPSLWKNLHKYHIWSSLHSFPIHLHILLVPALCSFH